jgi:DNA-binding LytR/AlgR family response regulator
MAIKILVADDEELPRARLCRILKNLVSPQFELVVQQAANGAEALQMLGNEEFDIAYLDIEMPLMTGFQVVEEFRHASKTNRERREPAFVYQTAYSEFGSQAFDQDAADYLLKPVNEERVKRSIERCFKLKDSLARVMQGDQDPKNKVGLAVSPAKYISASVNGLTRVIATEEVVYISAESGAATAFLLDGSEMCLTDSLTLLESKLNSNQFIRIHRSFIVSIDAVRRLIHRDGNWVELSNQTRLPVARRKLSLLKERLKFT